MATIRSHGGSCCGRRHMFGMDGATTASIIADMRSEGLLSDDPDEMNKITEIVVSNENANLRQLQQEIVGAGFVLVAVWDNNSGTRCYMYLHANDWTAYPNGAAIDVEPPVPAAPAPRPAPQVVFTTFHNHVRGARSEAGWPSLEAARRAAPRAARVDRRDVYASGAVRWADNVE